MFPCCRSSDAERSFPLFHSGRPPQLITVSKHIEGYNPVSFTDVELKFGVAAAQSHLQHKHTTNGSCCLSLLRKTHLHPAQSATGDMQSEVGNISEKGWIKNVEIIFKLFTNVSWYTLLHPCFWFVGVMSSGENSQHASCQCSQKMENLKQI